MNLKLKKYQTQKFVNEFFQKNGKKYKASVRKQALLILKKKGFAEFEYLFVFNNLDRLAKTIDPVIKNIQTVFENLAKNLKPIVDCLGNFPKQDIQNFNQNFSHGFREATKNIKTEKEIFEYIDSILYKSKKPKFLKTPNNCKIKI